MTRKIRSTTVSGLTTFGASTRARSYTHDSAGSRLSETVAGNTIHYGYDGLNRLTERTQPAMSVQLSHGETVSLPAGTWRYSHDGRGLRTSKVQLNAQGAPITSTRIRYVYGPDGLLHGETSAGGTTLTTVYIWLNGEPIGLIRNNTLYHVHSDHLGRPEVVTNAARTIVWRAENLAWDRKVATSSIGEYNLGFPGQYRDSESAQWYNWFRTYDGSIGRYTQADPIGLGGGMNLYLYANANPVNFVDSLGLLPEDVRRAVCDFLGGPGTVTDAWRRALDARKANLPSSWDDSVNRPAENYLYALAAVTEYGDNAVRLYGGTIVHQGIKPAGRQLGFPTSPFSLKALSAGLEGVADGAAGRMPQCGCR